MREPKAMEEIHKIREKMSRMSYVELENELEAIRKKHKGKMAS